MESNIESVNFILRLLLVYHLELMADIRLGRSLQYTSKMLQTSMITLNWSLEECVKCPLH